jgi:drug/metabolite transporter (DMT)-like permease
MLMLVKFDARLKAVTFLCVAMILAVSSDTISKYLSARYPVHEFGALRYSVTIPIGILMAWSALQQTHTGIRDWRPLLLRASLTTIGNLLFMMAAATISLADGVAIYFTMPFFVAGIVPSLLGEKVPLIRWLVIAVGFGGVLVMTRPGTSVFQPETLLALGCAFLYGLGQALTRKIDPQLPSSVTALWQSIFMALFYACLGIFFAKIDLGATGNKSIDFLTRAWIMPSWPDFSLIIFSGILSSLQLPLVVYAYKHAEASFIAPFEYTAMLWAVLWGMAVFGDIPDGMTITGAVIVVFAGLFMVRFDRNTPLP